MDRDKIPGKTFLLNTVSILCVTLDFVLLFFGTRRTQRLHEEHEDETVTKTI